MNKVKPPIDHVAGNLVFNTNEDVWAVFRVPGRSYRSEPARRKAGLGAAFEMFAKSVEADFQILRVARRFDVQEYIDAVMKRAGVRGHKRLWEKYLEGQRERLESLRSFSPATFVCVRLADPGQDFQEQASRLLERTPKEIVRGFSQNRKKSYQEIQERAQSAAALAESTLHARPATAAEIQWLIRRALYRSLTEPRISPVEDGSVARWLSEDGFKHGYRHVMIYGEEGESWQAGLCVGEVQDAERFTRSAELMFTPLEDHPWPVDACLNVRYVRNEQAKRNLHNRFARKVRQLEEEEAVTSYGAMDVSHERVAAARDYHRHLTRTGEPMLLGTLSFMVSAPSEDELNRRVRAFKESFPWHAYRPMGDQLDVWTQHLPGQRTLVRGFERPYTPEQVGAMVPQATHEAGSDTPEAVYIGPTYRGRQPTFFDLAEGSNTDKSSVVALLGSQGGGKTATLQLFEWQAFLRGARIVDIDPKGDHRFHLIPEVARHTRVIKLDATSEHAGRLDPLRVAPDDERHDAATTYLTDILPPVAAEVQAAIHGAVARVIEKHGAHACCREVVAELERGERPEEIRAGYLLSQYQNAGIARLGFARLEDPIPTKSQEQVTYLQIRALKRANIGTVRSEMSQSQRHGRAVLQLVALYAMRILGDERERLKILSFDEASFLTQDAVGHQLLDTLNRWGRSELAVSLISSQILSDYEDQANLIGHWFLFAMRDRAHAKKALEDLEMDGTGPLVDALCERYGRGRALYRDLNGRAEEIQIDLGDLLEALNTTPKEKDSEPEPDVDLVEAPPDAETIGLAG